MDTETKRRVDAWLTDPAVAPADKHEIQALVDAGNDADLTDRFYRELAFGTGGMRGIIGAGINRINTYTIGRAAQGLANYVAKQGDDAKRAGVAIAYDSRRKSVELAQRTAEIMAGNGITAHLFNELRPTPVLSFAVRHLGCTAGVVITASHNPPEYNGFKVYWSDGAQITPPHDARIIHEVHNVGAFSNIRTADIDTARRDGLIYACGRELDESFLERVDASCLNPDACRRQGDRLKIVFTALHGTGGTLAPEALRRRGFKHVIEVPQQAAPDGEFPTVASPNPEEGAALAMGIALAQKENADLVIGTDPDADRVGAAVRNANGEYQLITGHQMGSLLCHYCCDQRKRNGTFPPNGVVLSTIVTTKLINAVAESYGAEVVETLTGFKWIGQALGEYDRRGTPDKPSKTFIFAAEESYGYLPAPFARDKDAVTSAAYIAEMAAAAADDDKTLLDVLDDLHRRFGCHVEGAKSITLPGMAGAEKIRAMMDAFRKQPPESIGGVTVATCTDLQTGATKDVRSGDTVGRIELPRENVLVFNLDGGGAVIARPSGTEPKIKFYCLLQELADDLTRARIAAADKIKAIFEDMASRAG